MDIKESIKLGIIDWFQNDYSLMIPTGTAHDPIERRRMKKHESRYITLKDKSRIEVVMRRKP